MRSSFKLILRWTLLKITCSRWDGWMGRWMDGWMDGCPHSEQCPSLARHSRNKMKTRHLTIHTFWTSNVTVPVLQLFYKESEKDTKVQLVKREILRYAVHVYHYIVSKTRCWQRTGYSKSETIERKGLKRSKVDKHEKMEPTSSGVYLIVTNKVSWIRWNKKKGEDSSIFKLLCDDSKSNMNFWSRYSKNKELCNSCTQQLLELEMNWPSKMLSSSKYCHVEKRRITRCIEMGCSETWLMLPFAPIGSPEL